MIVEAGKTYVRKLRALSASRDELALRLRLERTLAHANLHPAWLPPSAILCVRMLRGGGAAAARASGNRRAAHADWERAIAARLDSLARRAARPARESVAAGAEAVIFDDQAELLACLAVDWCGGVEATRWWWQSLFGVREVAAALLPAWRAYPEHVPAALAHLSKAGRLNAFARALDARDARDIRRRVTHKFSLRALEDALETNAQGAGRSRPAEGQGERPHGGNAARHSSRAPWEQFVPQARAEELGDEQSSLVGTALMLLRAPAFVRSSAFAESVSRWRLGAQAPAESDSAPTPAEDARALTDDFSTESLRGFDHKRERAPGAEQYARQGTTDAQRSLQATPDAAAGSTSSAELNTDARGLVPEVNGASVERRTAGRVARGRAEFSTSAQEAGRPSEALPTTPHAAAEEGERAPQTFIDPREYESRIRTEFGGVFYLINVALFLNLYGDFTTPLARGIDLPVWDFLALVGSETGGGRVRRDPVWTLLRKLSGRDEGEKPGANFTPPDEWRVPPGWLAAFKGRGAWSWNAEDGRLRVLHPRGFLILDVPAAADAGEQLEVETAAYAEHLRGPLRPAPFSTACRPAGTLEGWLGRLLPYLRARLGRALGVRASRALGRLVCGHNSRVAVTATRLDVTFELARLPLEVRLAGLDRDPGWVPAAGRHVAFHYE